MHEKQYASVHPSPFTIYPHTNPHTPSPHTHTHTQPSHRGWQEVYQLLDHDPGQLVKRLLTAGCPSAAALVARTTHLTGLVAHEAHAAWCLSIVQLPISQGGACTWAVFVYTALHCLLGALSFACFACLLCCLLILYCASVVCIVSTHSISTQSLIASSAHVYTD